MMILSIHPSNQLIDVPEDVHEEFAQLLMDEGARKYPHGDGLDELFALAEYYHHRTIDPTTATKIIERFVARAWEAGPTALLTNIPLLTRMTRMATLLQMIREAEQPLSDDYHAPDADD